MKYFILLFTVCCLISCSDDISQDSESLDQTQIELRSSKSNISNANNSISNFISFTKQEEKQFAEYSVLLINRSLMSDNFSKRRLNWLGNEERDMSSILNLLAIEETELQDLQSFHMVADRFLTDPQYQMEFIKKYGSLIKDKNGNNVLLWETCSAAGHIWGVLSSAAALAAGCAGGGPAGCVAGGIYAVNQINDLSNCA